jgi:predicted RNA binding protein YcfA (HicA-like mRNA interferase family)
MKKLPRDLKPASIVKALQRAGFEIDHVTGSHYILRKGTLRTTIPFHKTVRVGTLRAVLSQVAMTVDEFIELL